MAVEAILQSAAQRSLSSSEIETLKCLLFPEQQVILTVNLSIYPISVVQRALYWLANEVSLRLEAKNDSELCIITQDKLESEQLPALQNKLLIALNDFTLRLEIEEKTAAVRQQLVQLAISPNQAASHGHVH